MYFVAEVNMFFITYGPLTVKIKFFYTKFGGSLNATDVGVTFQLLQRLYVLFNFIDPDKSYNNNR